MAAPPHYYQKPYGRSRIGIFGRNSEFGHGDIDRQPRFRNRNPAAEDLLAPVTIYFFDLRADDIVSRDEEGEDLPDVDVAHREALKAFACAIRDAVMQGRSGQEFTVEVRDALGPVLKITGLIASMILRKQ